MVINIVAKHDYRRSKEYLLSSPSHLRWEAVNECLLILLNVLHKESDEHKKRNIRSG